MLRLAASFDGEVRQRPVVLEERLVVGSDEASDWVLPFPGISRRHARIEATAQGVELIDLGSKNGIVVGDERLERVLLRPGRAAILGRATVVLEELSTSEVELALALDAPDRDLRPSPIVGTGERGTAPISALRLARDLERLPRDPPESERSEILAKVAEAVGAEGIWTFAVAEEDLFLRDCVGEVPTDDVLEAIDSARREAMESGGRTTRIGFETRSARGFLFGFGGEKAFLAVAFAPGPEVPPVWVQELLKHLALRVGGDSGGTRVSPRSGAPPPGGLRLPDGMVRGRSEAMEGLLEHLEAAARSDLQVLLLGETGTGKELVARALHASGSHCDGPFVAVNCAAIPGEMLEAELFGVAARVATGVDPRPGRFLQASGGTLFLDEIGELPDRLQAKLLRVLQEREVLPLGGDRPRPVDARIVAASNADLRQRLSFGEFRRDLYHRISGMELHVPPLRDRVQDIPELVRVFADRFAEKYGRRIHGVSRKALRLLMAYEWPGNVRELQNAVERAVLLCPRGGALESHHFGPVRWAVEQGAQGEAPFQHYRSRDRERDHPADLPPPDPDDFRPLQERIDAVEIQAIREALALAEGNKTRAAELLGITPNGLRMKMRRLGLD